jgi:hypothetical protein
MYSGPMPELLGLAELKKRAKAAGYTKISRPADAGSAVPLDSWNGFTAETGSGSVHIGFSYILNGNTVIVRKMGEADIYYGLS